MKALIQRVLESQVAVGQNIIGRIGPGLLVFLGVEKRDRTENAKHLADRILTYRVFNDDQGKMNRSVQDIGGQILVVSQFTLVADVTKGRRPNFTPAAVPNQARELFQNLVDRLMLSGLTVETGSFGDRMVVSLHNDGPVTFMLES